MENDSLISQIFFMWTDNKKLSPIFDDVIDKLIDNDNFMRKALKDNPQWLKHYTDVTDALDEYDALAIKEHFIDGFKLGLKLAMEILKIE